MEKKYGWERKMLDNLKVYLYETPVDCLKSYFNSDVLPTNDDGLWEYYDVDGKLYKLKMSDAIEKIKVSSCWGFTRHKKELHLWVGKKADLATVAYMCAHEMGHTLRPYHRSDKAEEVKAEKYGLITMKAVNMAKDLLEMAENNEE